MRVKEHRAAISISDYQCALVWCTIVVIVKEHRVAAIGDLGLSPALLLQMLSWASI